MRISEIAKDLGRSSKELMEFLNEQGASYKNAANGITPEEE